MALGVRVGVRVAVGVAVGVAVALGSITICGPGSGVWVGGSVAVSVGAVVTSAATVVPSSAGDSLRGLAAAKSTITRHIMMTGEITSAICSGRKPVFKKCRIDSNCCCKNTK